jgi:hypothetical protein
MDMLRSAGSVIVAFAVMFLGGVWVLRGAPIPSLAAIKLKPDPAQTMFRERQSELAKPTNPAMNRDR